jgi:hypothetical protein
MEGFSVKLVLTLPLFADGLRKIRRNLVLAQSGHRPKAVKIGFFTAEQLTLINEVRTSRGFHPCFLRLFFMGRIYTRADVSGTVIQSTMFLSRFKVLFQMPQRSISQLRHLSSAIPT